eukprot:6172308-Pleurochrysis_carterae.AAC.1
MEQVAEMAQFAELAHACGEQSWLLTPCFDLRAKMLISCWLEGRGLTRSEQLIVRPADPLVAR